jgi:hydroxymethylbilane synthase
MGTRGSALALWQTRRVAAWLADVVSEGTVAEVVIRTRGDRDTASPLPDIGGRGVFTEELERALLDHEIDAAVHSLKDLPIAVRTGLRIGAVCFREDVRDVLITRDGRRLGELSPGDVVGSSSTRREAQLRACRPDLRVQPIRGNVETRIARVDRGEYDAVILAAAGVRRLELQHCVAEYLDPDAFLPAPGQGALAVQCRDDDEPLTALFAQLDEPAARACTDAERAFLAGLGGGCSLPVAAWAEMAGTGATLVLRGFAGSARDGRSIRLQTEGPAGDAATIGLRLAGMALERGAAELLQ